jgi:DNA-binding NarL/FixJ family response regulator
MERQSVFLIDSNQLFREGLKLLLADRGWEIAGEARFLAEVRPPLVAGPLDLVVARAGTDFPATEAALGAIRAHHPAVKTVLLADPHRAVALSRALVVSADAQLTTDISAATLMRALDRIMAAERALPGSRDARRSGLSARERQLVQGFAGALANRTLVRAAQAASRSLARLCPRLVAHGARAAGALAAVLLQLWQR